MHYFLICPLKKSGKDLFTYHYEKPLGPGCLVMVPFGKYQVVGVVIAKSAKPTFKTKAIAEVLDITPLPQHLLELAVWISEYYASPLPQALHMMIPARPHVQKKFKTVKEKAPLTKSFELSPEQIAAIKVINSSDSSQFLLHGVTGSGKTQVYIELAMQELAAGKSVIVLVPEIALATQTVRQFKTDLGSKVLITHSGMSNPQRRIVWQKLLSGEPYVVIGPRSALFSPIKNLGLIVVDECHEPSYKQDQTPRYHAASTAARLRQLAGAKLVLGSATPSAADIFLQRHGKLTLVKMEQRIHNANRHVEIVKLDKTRSIISPELQKAIKQTLQRKRQVLLFLNRRGSASQVVCADCGWVALCPNCQIPQTWHADQGQLQCHWCGHKRKLPSHCPECQNMQLRFLGVGTKKVEQEVASLFPNAKIARLDKDSFSAKTIEDLIKKLHEGKIDIIIGTQMVAKGLDIPGISLVGVVLADTMLYLPDYNAAERTFQLLYQVIGRAGRSHDEKSHVIIQTYNDSHPAIKAAAAHAFDSFIDYELAERQALGFPPYRYLLKLECVRKTRAGAKLASDKLAASLRKIDGVDVLGPAPSWQETLGGRFYWQIVVSAKQRKRLVEIVNNLPANWRADLDPINLL